MFIPEWNKNKGIALLRLGGLSPVKQTVRLIAPERRGLWAFIFPYWDWWFLSGEMSKDKFPKKVPKHPRPRKFWAQGTIYTRLCVPNAIRMDGWYRTTDRNVFDYLRKQVAQDIAQLRQLKDGAQSIRDPYFQGGMSVGHMEVFVSARARIT